MYIYCQGLKLDPGQFFCSLKVASRCVYILSGSETGGLFLGFLQLESGSQCVCVCVCVLSGSETGPRPSLRFPTVGKWQSGVYIFCQGLKLGRSSCLQTLLTLMEVQKQTTYHCPPDLLCAGLDLVHSLWRGRRETAMEVLRSK